MNLATDSDGNSYTGDDVEVVGLDAGSQNLPIDAHQKRQAALEADGGSTSPLQRATNHTLSKRLVAYAKDTKAALVLEELTHMRDRIWFANRSAASSIIGVFGNCGSS